MSSPDVNQLNFSKNLQICAEQFTVCVCVFVCACVRIYHPVQLVSSFFDPLGVVAVDHKYQPLKRETERWKKNYCK